MVDEAVEPNPVRNIGKVQMFVAGTDFEAYAEQLEFFCVAKRFITINLNSYAAYHYVRAWRKLLHAENIKFQDLSWNFSFQAVRLSICTNIPILLFYTTWFPHCHVTSNLICINQNLEQLRNQECYHNKTIK